MPSVNAITQIVAVISAVGALGGLYVALRNARTAADWKRADLASGFIKELSSNEELVFACRALDWNGGLLVLPDTLRPLLPPDPKTPDMKAMVHSRAVMHDAMKPGLSLSAMEKEPRLQVYRTALDSLLTWLSLIDHALARDLFSPVDIRDVGYWVTKVQSAQWLDDFVKRYGYAGAMERLGKAFKGVYDQTVDKVDDAIEQENAEMTTPPPETAAPYAATTSGR
jgi:hypothetical protein